MCVGSEKPHWVNVYGGWSQVPFLGPCGGMDPPFCNCICLLVVECLYCLLKFIFIVVLFYTSVATDAWLYYCQAVGMSA